MKNQTAQNRSTLEIIRDLLIKEFKCQQLEVQGRECLRSGEGQNFVFYKDTPEGRVMIAQTSAFEVHNDNKCGWFHFYSEGIQSLSLRLPKFCLGLVDKEGKLHEIVSSYPVSDAAN